MENTEVVKKTGNWFARLSTGSKAAVVVGVVGVLTGVTILVIHLTKKKGGKTVGGSKTNTIDATANKPDEVVKESGSNNSGTVETSTSSTTSSSSTDVSNSLPQQSNLPNDGKGCGQVKDKFDRDFNYIKCGNDWYTISKANPATPANNGKIPNWKSLDGNKAATSRLNARYPNG